jgi:hypothetical protein
MVAKKFTLKLFLFLPTHFKITKRQWQQKVQNKLTKGLFKLFF